MVEYVWLCVELGRRDSIYGCLFLFFQAEDGIRDLVRSRGLGDVYKRQGDRTGGENFRGAGGRRAAGRNRRERVGDA